MGLHAQFVQGEVPFAAIIGRIEALREELAELKPKAQSDEEMRKTFGLKSNDLRGEYAQLAAAAANKVANWLSDDEKLGPQS